MFAEWEQREGSVGPDVKAGLAGWHTEPFRGTEDPVHAGRGGHVGRSRPGWAWSPSHRTWECSGSLQGHVAPRQGLASGGPGPLQGLLPAWVGVHRLLARRVPHRTAFQDGASRAGSGPPNTRALACQAPEFQSLRPHPAPARTAALPGPRPGNRRTRTPKTASEARKPLHINPQPRPEPPLASTCSAPAKLPLTVEVARVHRVLPHCSGPRSLFPPTPPLFFSPFLVPLPILQYLSGPSATYRFVF